MARIKAETLARFKREALAIIASYSETDPEEIKMCISAGNDKIGRVMNVSMMPVLTCGNCSHCAPFCYDVRSCIRFNNTTLQARIRNTVLFKKDPAEYFHRIREKIRRARTCRHFRWHVGGEIPNAEYFAEMVRIAEEFPEWTFWTYTKMYRIVNDYVAKHGDDRFAAIPENLHIMFSRWDGMPMNNPYGFPEFVCRLDAGNVDTPAEWFDSHHKCPGKCRICIETGRGCVVGESTWNAEH